MKCEALRRAALTDPIHLDGEALTHLAVCPDCAHWYESVRRQEAALYRALSVPLPAELEPSARGPDDDGHPAETSARARRRPGALVLVSFLVVLGLTVAWLIPRPSGPEGLADAVAAHIAAEPWALAAEDPVPAATLARAFARVGGDLISTLRATYAERCPLPGGTVGEHIVLRTQGGKITLVLAPDTGVSEPFRRQENGLSLAVLPAGRGSLVLAADSDAQLKAAEEEVGRGVRWDQGKP
jgi:hypothetical protein